MKLNFDFSDFSRLTFYGDDVTGIRSDDSKVKAFIADESVALFDKRNAKLITPAGSSFTFSLKPKILLDSDFWITVDFAMKKAFSFTLFEGNGFQMIIHPDKLEVITDGLNYEIPYGLELGTDRHQLSIFREDNQMWMEVAGSQHEILPITVKGIFELATFLGAGIRPEQLEFFSFGVTNELEGILEVPEPEVSEEPIPDLPEEEPVEEPVDELPEEEPVEEPVEELPEEEPIEEPVDDTIVEVEEPVEEVEEIPEEIEEPQEEEEEIENPVTMKNYTELELKIISGYKGLLEAAEGTKVGKFYKTTKELEEAAKENKTFLVKVIYYILMAQPEWEKATHEEIKVRAYELFEVFGKDVTSTQKRYGFADGISYKSFKYGEISDADLTDELLVELLMEEYEGVRGLIVKK